MELIINNHDVPLVLLDLYICDTEVNKFLSRNTLMEVMIPPKRLVVRLAISVEGMTETELFGALDVIEEDTVKVVSLHGKFNSLGQVPYFKSLTCPY